MQLLMMSVVEVGKDELRHTTHGLTGSVFDWAHFKVVYTSFSVFTMGVDSRGCMCTYIHCKCVCVHSLPRDQSTGIFLCRVNISVIG